MRTHRYLFGELAQPLVVLPGIRLGLLGQLHQALLQVLRVQGGGVCGGVGE